MAALGNDCYFFCTSTCAKGAACPFRHVEAAKTCRVICQHWQMGACLRPMCKFRHSDFIFQVDTSEVPCYWELQPAGCMKTNCPYKHLKPRPQEEKKAAGVVPLQVDPSVGTTSNNEDIKSQNIIQPVITSTASQPSIDSEETSSSQRPIARQESEMQINAEKHKTELDDSKNSKADNNKLSVALQESKVKKKKTTVSPVIKAKQKSVTSMKKKREKNVADIVKGRVKSKAKKYFEQPRKSVKERLGRAPISQPASSSSPSEESESESGSESDDSIENIKVMSVEEILRQKALESMMKTRAVEGKTKRTNAAVVKVQTSLPATRKKMSHPAFNRETRTVHRDLPGPKQRPQTYVTATKKVKRVAAAVRSSSSSSLEEESCDENETIKHFSESSSDSSDSSSVSSSSDTDENSTDESEELDIRRVVVDLESEKAARKKDIETPMAIKNRLGATPSKMHKREVVHSEGRQVVLVLNGSKCDDASEIKPSDEQKKTKKRPWRSVRPTINPSAIDAIASDERASAVSSPPSYRDDYSVELDHHKDIRATDESPFEKLRRRALMKKLQAEESKKFKKSPSIEAVKTVDDSPEKPEVGQVVDMNTAVKTHKHKHGHKHKRVKIERQIYMPPAMKNTVTVSAPSLTPESVSPKQELIMTPAARVSPLKREPHRIAAAWTAGLALSSKGMSVRRPEPITLAGNIEISSRFKIPEQIGDRDIGIKSKEAISSSKMPEPAPESSVTIKSFAEIMAEKRKRRLEMQAQKADHSTSASAFLPAASNQFKSTISQSVDVKSAPRLVYTSDMSSDSSKTVTQTVQVTRQPVITTTKGVIPDISNVIVSSISSSAPAMSSSQGLIKSVGQKVRLKSTKKNRGDKRKRVKKLFTKRTSLEQSSQSCIVTSEDSNSNMLSSSFYPDTSTLPQTVTSSTDNTSLLHGGSKKTLHPAHKPFTASVIETSSSQAFQNSITTGLDMTDHGSVSKQSMETNTPDVQTQTNSSKHSVPSEKEDSEHARRNARLSLEDEFSFFEDEDMIVEDTSILENIEPIDNLLQDIDDLLS